VVNDPTVDRNRTVDVLAREGATLTDYPIVTPADFLTFHSFGQYCSLISSSNATTTYAYHGQLTARSNMKMSKYIARSNTPHLSLVTIVPV
jgi:hypothetical protein